jgi:hypothetical protein
MRSAEEIERDIRQLPRGEYSKLREWFMQQDNAAWDAKFEADVLTGKLDSLGRAAREAHAAGRTTKL